MVSQEESDLHIRRRVVVDAQFAHPCPAIHQGVAFMEDTIYKIAHRDVELRVVFVFPDMLGIRNGVQDVLLIEQSANSSVGWLLLVWPKQEQLLGQFLESSNSRAQHVPASSMVTHVANTYSDILCTRNVETGFRKWQKARVESVIEKSGTFQEGWCSVVNSQPKERCDMKCMGRSLVIY